MNEPKMHINYRTTKGPWGGGNQFLKALKKQIKKMGRYSKSLNNADVVLFNSHHDLDAISGLKNKLSNKMWVHRIDGPISLIRRKDELVDNEIFKINNEIANVSIFQSQWSLSSTLKLGYNPIYPIVIHNASDPEIFNTLNRILFSDKRKIRIISSSWSDNPRKGGQIYRWLDRNLDFERFEYSFVGRCSEPLSRIRVIEPVDSSTLALYLRSHDIYITASDNDPCSNALIEALSCGLPTIYYNRGGHSEIVGQGGLGFNNPDEIPDLLLRIMDNYDQYTGLISIPTIIQVANKYIDCFRLFSN